MSKNLLILFSFLFLQNINHLNAQSKNIAYVLTQSGRSDTWNKINNNLIKSLNDNFADDLFFYQSDNNTLTYLPELNGNKTEVTAKYLRRYNFNLYEDYTPNLIEAYDTIKKENLVFFQLNNYTTILTKTTNLETSQIVQNSIKHIKLVDDHFLKIKSRIFIKDYKKLFGGSPSALRSKNAELYNKTLNQLYKDMRPTLVQYFEQKEERLISYMVAEQVKALESEVNLVDNPLIEKDILKNFKIIPTKKGSKYSAAFTSVFSLDTLDNYIYSTNKGLYVGNTETDGTIIFSKAPFKSGKEAAEVLASGKPLYYQIGGMNYGDKLNENKPPILAINTGDIELDASFERYFNKMKDIHLYDIVGQPIIKQMREKYKGERFIDNPIHVNDHGATFLLTKNDEKAVITNLENGAIAGTFNLEESAPVIYNALLDALAMNIEVIKVEKEKKGKAEELLLYSPLGFTKVEKLEVYAVNTEKVGGKSVERREKIGELKPSNEAFDEDKGRAERREVASGHKEIYEAIQSGKKLVIRSNEKVGLLGKMNKLNDKLGKMQGLNK